MSQASRIQPVRLAPSEVILARNTLVLHNLDPITIGVEEERNIVHLAVRQPLLPVTLEILESLACRIKVVHRNACIRYR